MKKYQIFISATYKDLEEERIEVIKTVLRMNHIPIGMEMFNAEDEDQWKIMKRNIDYSDYYVLIVGFRYGSVGEDNISYTEKEYDYAISKNIPVLSFLKSSSSGNNSIENVDKDRTLIEKFRNKILNNGKMSDFWSNKDDLSKKMATALHWQFDNSPRLGWVKSNAQFNLGEIQKKEKKLDLLCNNWNSYGYLDTSNNIYKAKIKIFYEESFGYKVESIPIDDNDFYEFNGQLRRNDEQYFLIIQNKKFDETLVFSFMKVDIPTVEKTEMIILGVHLGFSHTRHSKAGIGILSSIELKESEIIGILGENVNIKIDDKFKKGLNDFYDFDNQKLKRKNS